MKKFLVLVFALIQGGCWAVFGGPESAVAARVQAQFGNLAVNRQDFEQAQVAEYVSCLKAGTDLRICDRLPGATFSRFGGYMVGGLNRGEAVGLMTLQAEGFRQTLAGSVEVNNLSDRMGANEAVDARQGVELRSQSGRINTAQGAADEAKAQVGTVGLRVSELAKVSHAAFNGLARRVEQTEKAKPEVKKTDGGDDDNPDDDDSSPETCPTEEEGS